MFQCGLCNSLPHCLHLYNNNNLNQGNVVLNFKLLPAILFSVHSLLFDLNDDKVVSKVKCDALFNQLDQKKNSQSLKEFDQSFHNGWRILEAEDCYLEGAILIQNYMKEKGSTDQNLYFHAGQLYALNNDYSPAIALMRKSLLSANAKTNDFLWNEYVLGVIAFLDRNQSDLLKYKNILQEKGGVNTNNTTILIKLLNNFNLPYSTALNN